MDLSDLAIQKRGMSPMVRGCSLRALNSALCRCGKSLSNRLKFWR
jgi:CDGSH-type Zn-finger protein